MNLQGKKVVVFGLGSTGSATCTFCASRGAEVWGVDDLGLEAYGRERAAALQEAGVRLRLGGADRELLRGANLVVVSPGIPPSSLLARAEESGVPMVSEVELASWYAKAPIIGITGTNGKSTVTALIGAMLAASGKPTFVGGNFGRPFIEAVRSQKPTNEPGLAKTTLTRLSKRFFLKAILGCQPSNKTAIAEAGWRRWEISLPLEPFRCKYPLDKAYQIYWIEPAQRSVTLSQDKYSE